MSPISSECGQGPATFTVLSRGAACACLHSNAAPCGEYGLLREMLDVLLCVSIQFGLVHLGGEFSPSELSAYCVAAFQLRSVFHQVARRIEYQRISACQDRFG